MRTRTGIFVAAALIAATLTVASMSRGQLRPSATGAILCSVRDGSTLKGIGGAKVTLRWADRLEPLPLQITDASGKTEKIGVPVGPVEVVVYKKHYIREPMVEKVTVKKDETAEITSELVNNRADAAYYERLIDVIASRSGQEAAAFDAVWARLMKDHLHPFGLAAIAAAISKKGGSKLPTGKEFETYRSLDRAAITTLRDLREPSGVDEAWSVRVATNTALPALVKRAAVASVLTDASISAKARREVLVSMDHNLPRSESRALRNALDPKTLGALKEEWWPAAAAAPPEPPPPPSL